jgi:hypothetical protein
VVKAKTVFYEEKVEVTVAPPPAVNTMSSKKRGFADVTNDEFDMPVNL